MVVSVSVSKQPASLMENSHIVIAWHTKKSMEICAGRQAHVLNLELSLTVCFSETVFHCRCYELLNKKSAGCIFSLYLFFILILTLILMCLLLQSSLKPETHRLDTSAEVTQLSLTGLLYGQARTAATLAGQGKWALSLHSVPKHRFTGGRAQHRLHHQTRINMDSITASSETIGTDILRHEDEVSSSEAHRG